MASEEKILLLQEKKKGSKPKLGDVRGVEQGPDWTQEQK